MATSAKVFDSDDLRFLDASVDRMVQEIRGGAPLSAAHDARLKERLAVTVLQCAVPGVHDHAKIRAQVLKTMFWPGDPASARRRGDAGGRGGEMA